MDCRGCLARFGLFIFNFMFMVSGLVVIFVGMLPKMSPDIVKIQHIVTLDSGDGAFNTASTVLIIFGVVILLFAAFGFFFVCLPKKCSGGKKLFGGLYIIFLSLVLIGEVGVEITAAVFKGKLDDQLLKKSLGSNYKEGNNLQAQAWDVVQVWLTCCGSKGPHDYFGTIFTDTNRHVPDTCCVLTNNDLEHIDVKNYFACQLEAYQIQQNVSSSTSDFIKKEGCIASFESQINGHLAQLVSVGVGFPILELLGIVLACYVYRTDNDNIIKESPHDNDNDDRSQKRPHDNDNVDISQKSSHVGATRGRMGDAVIKSADAGRVHVCASCDGPIRGPFVDAMGKSWCPDHFICANPRCGKNLVDIDFVKEGGLLYCEKDYDLLNAPHCFKCDAAIIGKYVEALTKKYHPECFLCYHCKQPLGGKKFHLEDDKLYCENDWRKINQKMCTSCNFPIEPGDSFCEAMGNNYHSECFKCSYCQVNLAGQAYYPKAGMPFCENHAQ